MPSLPATPVYTVPAHHTHLVPACLLLVMSHLLSGPGCRLPVLILLLLLLLLLVGLQVAEDLMRRIAASALERQQQVGSS